MAFSYTTRLDATQAAVLADHDSRVLARWRPRCSPWMLGELLDRALRKALAAGYAGITVACEPTGHRWMVISQLAAERGMAMVCVQPLVVPGPVRPRTTPVARTTTVTPC